MTYFSIRRTHAGFRLCMVLSLIIVQSVMLYKGSWNNVFFALIFIVSMLLLHALISGNEMQLVISDVGVKWKDGSIEGCATYEEIRLFTVCEFDCSVETQIELWNGDSYKIDVVNSSERKKLMEVLKLLKKKRLLEYSVLNGYTMKLI